MDTQNSIFDTIDLDEIRRLIGEEPAPKKKEEPVAPTAPVQSEPTPAAPAQPREEKREEKQEEILPQQPAPRAEKPAPAPQKPPRARAEQTDSVSSGVQRDVARALEQHREDADAEKPPRGYEAYTMLHDLVMILAVLTLVFVFFFRLVGVDGESMIPTLYDKDYLILESNFLYRADDIERGDVVVLKVETDAIDKPIVKRVIATEGQTVDIDFETGEVTVDGKILIEPYIYELTYESYAEYGLSLDYPVTVPKGHIFVMGDDRNHSADSRYAPIGCVSTDSVLGKVLFLVFPGRETDVYGNVVGKRDFSRIGAVS